ncbi:thioredoxin [Sorangium cellulosum]|uniref:Thioredoxin n=1 Tax=Sorangium cellulosum TaxID=56 RepID=A0A4P2PY13_SORCE|nr:thioredoxin family protein [Sorangium cellulosum]AUX21551.1 thioredoxin [Sorangium cellulosum]
MDADLETWRDMEAMIMNPVHELDDLRFDAEVLEAQVPVLVDFTAQWCPPCRALTPILHRLAAESAGHLEVMTVDGDRYPSLARRFGIRAFPTVIAFAGGKEVARHVGLTTKEKLLKLVEGREVRGGARQETPPAP